MSKLSKQDIYDASVSYDKYSGDGYNASLMIGQLAKELLKALDKGTDYHDFCYRGSTKEHCKRLSIGTIYVNAALCNCCGYFIRSRNKHDMVTCKCGKVSVDGGSHYCKRSGVPENYKDVIELFDWANT